MTVYDGTGGPPWLLDPDTDVGKTTFVTRLAADAVLEKLSQGVRASMPGLGTPSALPYIGKDNVIVRGAKETNAQYVARNSAVYDTWDHAGSRRAVLEAVWWQLFDAAVLEAAYPWPVVPICATVTSNGSTATWATLYSTSDPAEPAIAKVSPPAWSWDGLQFGRRAWLVLYFHGVPTARTGSAASITANANDLCTVMGLMGMTSADVGRYLLLSGSGSAANGGTHQIVAVPSSNSATVAIVAGVAPDSNNGAIGWEVVAFPSTAPAPVCGCPGLRCDGDTSGMVGQYQGAVVTCGLTNPPDLAGIRSSLRQWKSATTRYQWILCSFGGGSGALASEELSPNTAHNPAGTWATWATVASGVSVYSRNTGVDLGGFLAPCDGSDTYYLSTDSVPSDT